MFHIAPPMLLAAYELAQKAMHAYHAYHFAKYAVEAWNEHRANPRSGNHDDTAGEDGEG
jgi:hypothetical protein